MARVALENSPPFTLADLPGVLVIDGKEIKCMRLLTESDHARRYGVSISDFDFPYDIDIFARSVGHPYHNYYERLTVKLVRLDNGEIVFKTFDLASIHGNDFNRLLVRTVQDLRTELFTKRTIASYLYEQLSKALNPIASIHAARIYEDLRSVHLDIRTALWTYKTRPDRYTPEDFSPRLRVTRTRLVRVPRLRFQDAMANNQDTIDYKVANPKSLVDGIVKCIKRFERG